jgi:hypothetical protein
MPALCWQGQHDPSFWFGETAGEVSRQLNALVDLGCIDTALSTAAKQASEEKGRVSFCQESLTKAEADAGALSWVPEFVADAETLDKLCTMHSEAVSDLDAMDDHVSEINRVTSFLSSVAAVAEAGTSMLELGTLFLEADTQKNELVNILMQIQATQDQFAKANKMVECGDVMLETGNKVREVSGEYTSLGFLIAGIQEAEQTAAYRIPDFAGVQKQHDIYVEKAASLLSLTAIVDHITTAQEEICHAESESQKLKSQMPLNCPTCGQSL